MKRKITYVSGTRADYGLMQKTLRGIEDHPNLDLDLIVTGMHLMKSKGMTVEAIKKDGFNFTKCSSIFESDESHATIDFISDFLIKLKECLINNPPDILLLLGDRPEMIAAAMAGQYMGIPVAHIHGGDVSSNVDDSVRHAITKLADIHLPATQDAANRIIKMGESPDIVFVVGSPGLENIRDIASSTSMVENHLNINLKDNFILLLMHPQNGSSEESHNLAKNTIEAIKKLDIQTIALYPNADAGSEAIVKILDSEQNKDFHVFKHVNREDFLGLLRDAAVFVGNSSSGIIEAASFNTSVLNIGTRQDRRLRPDNVCDIPLNSKDILKELRDLLDRKKTNISNPYEKESTSQEIVNILLDVDIKRLKTKSKQITY